MKKCAFENREKTNPIQTHRRSEFIPTRREHVGNQNHHPRTAYASINMQNKPNFPTAKMNLTTYYNTAYENIRLSGHRKNKPNFKPTASIYTGCTHYNCLSWKEHTAKPKLRLCPEILLKTAKTIDYHLNKSENFASILNDAAILVKGSE